MARRNVFDNVMKAAETPAEPVLHSVAKFGAAKSISSSIDELARQANRLILGETIVEIDPVLIDASFVADRMTDGDEAAFHDLLRAIRERGQDSPVLLRPNPDRPGRYQIVFGHRRVRAARELMRPVRAVIKSLQDIDLVLAQGQENSARANLSFIERVLFAARLADMGYGRDVIQAALSVDYQTLSKMLTIPKTIPAQLMDAIGPAKSVGRDRWLELRKLLERPGRIETVMGAITAPDFAALGSDERFACVFALAGKSRDLIKGGTIKKAIAPAGVKNGVEKWASPDQAVAAKIIRRGPRFTLELTSPKAAKTANGDFGDYVSRHLEALYQSFRQETGTISKDQSGD